MQISSHNTSQRPLNISSNNDRYKFFRPLNSNTSADHVNITFFKSDDIHKSMAMSAEDLQREYIQDVRSRVCSQRDSSYMTHNSNQQLKAIRRAMDAPKQQLQVVKYESKSDYDEKMEQQEIDMKVSLQISQNDFNTSASKIRGSSGSTKQKVSLVSINMEESQSPRPTSKQRNIGFHQPSQKNDSSDDEEYDEEADFNFFPGGSREKKYKADLATIQEGSYSRVTSVEVQKDLQEKKLYPYDYGYNPNPHKLRQQIFIKPGQNIHNLGGKTQINKIPVLKKKEFDPYCENSDQMVTSARKKIETIDPVKYLQQNTIKCSKYNYSVPSSYQDKEIEVKLSRDESALEIVENSLETFKKIKISKITGFIYGSFSTRFWMLRIGLNDQIADHLENLTTNDLTLPFYAWECISIQLPERDVDLVIKDAFQMKMVIQFLMIKLKTSNGLRNSVKINENDIRKLLPEFYKKYNIMKMRMKISYQACIQNKTVQELFLYSLLKTYRQRFEDGLIKNPYPKLSNRNIQNIRNFQLADYSRQRAKHICTGKNTQEEQLKQFYRKMSKKYSTQDIFRQHIFGLYEENDFNSLVSKAVTKKDLKYSDKKQKPKPVVNSEQKKLEKSLNSLFYKLQTQILDKQAILNKIGLIIRLRLVNGPLFIHSLLECIRLEKQILVLQLSQGIEISIPKQLDLKHLPLSYQYYDSILGMVRNKISHEQKHIIFQKANIMPNKDQQKIIEVELSLKEKFSRYFKSTWLGQKLLCDQEYMQKLQTYEKSRTIQNARYLQINNQTLRFTEVKPHSSKKEFIKHLAHRHDESKEDDHHDHQKMSCNIDISDIKEFNIDLEDPRIQVDLNYITHTAVGKKRHDLYVHKVQFQNQLMTLKEKGRRLLIADKVDIAQENIMKDMLEHEIHGHGPSQDVKEMLSTIVKYTAEFEDKALKHSEINSQEMRVQLAKILKKMKTFDERNNFIDKKIEYDQRFFNDHYPEFQLMISDIRKQIRINDEIISLRNKLKSIRDDAMQEELQQKKITLKELRDRANNNNLILLKQLSIDYHKNQKNRFRKSGVTQDNKRSIVSQTQQDKRSQVSHDQYLYEASQPRRESSKSPTKQLNQEQHKISLDMLDNSFSEHSSFRTKNAGEVSNHNSNFSELLGKLNQDDPRLQDAVKIQSQIIQKKSKIRNVRKHSQKSLWGKNGSYVPNSETFSSVTQFFIQNK